MARYFRLEEAEALLPMLREALQRASVVIAEAEKAEQEFNSFREGIVRAGGILVDHARVLDLRTRRTDAQSQLSRLVEDVQSTGCLIKDLNQGLIDFPALRYGEEVYLCWKLGEPGISFWHRVEDGFRGRRPIGKEFGLPKA